MKIILIGTFPPPIHGMAVMNQAIFERLLQEGWEVEKLNTSPQPSSNQVLSRMTRIRVFHLVWSYLLANNLKNTRVCLALSGGWGQAYDILTAFICRVKGAKFVVHHHSVVYLDKKRFITTLLFGILGRNTVHVALCEGMKINLEQKYGCKNVILLSNGTLMLPNLRQKSRDKIQTVGYLSNITNEKGGWDVIRLAELIREKAWPIKFKVAGPCQEPELNRSLQRAHERGALEWVGPVFNEQKRNFWDSLDLFIFPSQNEAEPLVVWEALSSGIPIIAYDRGCISTQIGESGKLIPKDVDFVESALMQIELWMHDSRGYKEYAALAGDRIEIVKHLAENQWQEYVLHLDQVIK